MRPKEPFQEDNTEEVKTHRVQKLLSNYGYCSRRKAEELIQEGRVKVNGKPITIGDKASVTDEISVNGKVVKGDKKVYIMFHKPTGCVTALKDPTFKTVMDHIRIKERVFPIGRLDYNTSGILLLTNDGDFANKVMHPRYEVKKRYVAVLDSPVTHKAIDAIEKGIVLEDGKTAPAKATIMDENIIDITIHEGKNKIIKRMLASLGYRVKALKRTSIGKLGIGSLRTGRYRNLEYKELGLIFK